MERYAYDIRQDIPRCNMNIFIVCLQDEGWEVFQFLDIETHFITIVFRKKVSS